MKKTSIALLIALYIAGCGRQDRPHDGADQQPQQQAHDSGPGWGTTLASGMFGYWLGSRNAQAAA
ncbi:MAG: hypothetical protein JWQ88_3657, partial [Rhodoferax sp.]|nr:hypothetical protein [Rhodoferax sp.]